MLDLFLVDENKGMLQWRFEVWLKNDVDYLFGEKVEGEGDGDKATVFENRDQNMREQE